MYIESILSVIFNGVASESSVKYNVSRLPSLAAELELKFN